MESGGWAGRGTNFDGRTKNGDAKKRRGTKTTKKTRGRKERE
jgi:hypothetical protein